MTKVTIVAESRRFSCRLEAVFVYALWAVLSCVMLAYVIRYASKFPYYDDLVLLSEYADGDGRGWGLWFRRFAGHFSLFNRLATVATWCFSDGDMRPLLWSAPVILSLGSLITLRSIRRIYSATRFDDAIVPLAILGTHAWTDAIWGMIVPFLLAAVIATVLTVELVRYAIQPRSGHMPLMLGTASLIALQGGSGLLTAIGFAPAFAVLIGRDFRSRGGSVVRWRQILTFASALIYISVTTLILFGHLLEPSVGGKQLGLASLVRGFSVPSGSLALIAWPAGGAFILGVLASIALAAWYRCRSLSMPEIVALSVLVPGLLLCVAFAAMRTAVQPWHISYAMPVWTAIYLNARFLMSPLGAATLMRGAMIVLALSSGIGIPAALETGRDRRESTRLLQADIDAGYPACRIAANNGRRWLKQRVSEYEHMLVSIGKLGKGDFARIPTDPRLIFTAIDPVPQVRRGCEEQGGVWKVSQDVRMYFGVGEQSVDAVRITIEVAGNSWNSTVALGPVYDGDER